MNKTQFDFIQHDIQVLLKDYLEKKTSPRHVLQSLMLILAWEPFPATQRLIDKALQQVPELAATYKLLIADAKQQELMELCQRIKNERG
jgi:hypothetical protein